MASPDLFLSAGDPSGDNAAGRVVTALREMLPGLSVFGLGGSRLKQLGQRQLADGSDLAVLGFWEVARRFHFFRNLIVRCADEIRARRPACVVLVDYPGFNLRLAERIKPLGIPVVYYISPQVWAWGRKRLEAIKRLVDLMLVILPFEKDVFDGAGVKATFVGHYLLEDIPQEQVASSVPVKGGLALLPGSRLQEIERMLPPMLETAVAFNRKHGTRAVVAAIKDVFDYEKQLARVSDAGSVSIKYGDSRKVIFESSLVVAASGTATLEAAIIGRPMVVVYKTGFVTYQIARRLVKLDRIALANLVLNDRVVPELVQRQATPSNMLRELERFWNDEAHYDAVRKKLNQVPQLLGGRGASLRAAKLISEYITSGNGR